MRRYLEISPCASSTHIDSSNSRVFTLLFFHEASGGREVVLGAFKSILTEEYRLPLSLFLQNKLQLLPLSQGLKSICQLMDGKGNLLDDNSSRAWEGRQHPVYLSLHSHFTLTAEWL